MQNNEEYWINRAENRILNAEKTSTEMIKDLKKLYQETLNKINKEIEAFIGRYSEKEGITIEDTKKLLTDSELKKFRKEAMEYYADLSKHAYDPAYRNKLKSQIYTTLTKDGKTLYSLRRNISRLEYLKMQIQFYVENMYMQENEAFTQKLCKTYEDTYMRANFDNQKAVGVYSSFNSLNDSIINKAVQEKWLGENYSSRIWTDKNKLLNTLETTFMQGVALGKNPRVIGREIAKTMDTKYSNCERLARTEFNHIANQATKDSYKQTNGVDKYKFVATLDFRTSAICRQTDGLVFLVSEAEEGVNYPPLHSRCRSATIPYFEDEDYSKLERIASDPKTGKSYFVPADMTYEQWRNSLTEEQGKYFVANQKSKAQYKSDMKQLQEYKKLSTQAKKQGYGELFEGMPTKIADFQMLKYLDNEKYQDIVNNAKIARKL